MRPYRIKSKHFSRWIDLDAIQMISDVVDRDIERIPVSVTGFNIGFAFCDKPHWITSRLALASTVKDTMSSLGRTSASYLCDAPARLAEVLEERREIHELHDELVAAWLSDQQHSPPNLKTV